MHVHALFHSLVLFYVQFQMNKSNASLYTYITIVIAIVFALLFTSFKLTYCIHIFKAALKLLSCTAKF